MKKLTSLILVSIFCVLGLPACAAPLPERKGGTIKLACDPTTQPDAAVTVIFYRSLPADVAWRIAGTASASYIGGGFFFNDLTANAVIGVTNTTFPTRIVWTPFP